MFIPCPTNIYACSGEGKDIFPYWCSTYFYCIICQQFSFISFPPLNLKGGPIFRLKGSILCMSFLDCNGALIPYSYEPWKDEGRQRDISKRPKNKHTFREKIIWKFIEIHMWICYSQLFSLLPFFSSTYLYSSLSPSSSSSLSTIITTKIQ